MFSFASSFPDFRSKNLIRFPFDYIRRQTVRKLFPRDFLRDSLLPLYHDFWISLYFSWLENNRLDLNSIISQNISLSTHKKQPLEIISISFSFKASISALDLSSVF